MTRSNGNGDEIRRVFLHMGKGEGYWLGDTFFDIKAPGELTDNAYTLTECTLSSGAEPPLHIHRNEDEAIYLLEGRLSARVGAEAFEAEPGSFVFMPKDVAHGFTIVEGRSARALFIHSPSKIEEFFRAVGQRGTVGTPPPPRPEVPPSPEVQEIIDRHGVEFP